MRKFRFTQSLTTNYEVPVSIPGSTVRIFPEGEDSRGDHGLGRLAEFEGPSWHYILLYHHSRHRDNATAPHGRPNLESRLHCCHAQEGGPRNPQGHVVALERKKNNNIWRRAEVMKHLVFLSTCCAFRLWRTYSLHYTCN